MTLGEQIKYWRKKRRISQEQLAKAIGVHGKAVIYQYEKGVRNPSHKTLELIAQALNCKVKILLEDNS